jgi:hypothetical protein
MPIVSGRLNHLHTVPMMRPSPWPAVLFWLALMVALWTLPPYGPAFAVFIGLGLFLAGWFWLAGRFPRTMLVISIFLFGGRRW